MIGAQVGVYRVVRQIGEGGMGAVWLAEHVMLGRQVAIKVLHREASARPELVERFFNEAKAATAISDPGIVQIFDFGLNTDGNAYIVMELLEGEPLDQRLRRLGKLPLASSLRILRQVASSLGAAHRRGIVHRDMKPDNVFLVRDPEVAGGERTKILDFGIAKLSSEHQRVKTQTSAVMGTPVFMSPEQCRGAGQVDRRSDVYSLGCVLYTLLTGHPPFDGEGPGDIIAMHLREPAPPPSREVPGLPPEIDELVLRCMSKDRDKRYDSGTELAGAIEGLIEKLAPLFASTGAPAAAKTSTSGELGGGGRSGGPVSGGMASAPRPPRPATGQPRPVAAMDEATVPARPVLSSVVVASEPAAPTLTPVPPPPTTSSPSISNAVPRQIPRAASEESTTAFPKVPPPQQFTSPMPPPQQQFTSPMPPPMQQQYASPLPPPMPSQPGMPAVQMPSQMGMPAVSSAQLAAAQPQFPSPLPPSMGPVALSTPPVTLETFAASGERPAISNSSTTLSAYAGARVPSKRPPRRLWMVGGVAAVGAVLGIALVTQLAGGDEPATTGSDAALAIAPDLVDSGATPPEENGGSAGGAGSAGSAATPPADPQSSPGGDGAGSAGSAGSTAPADGSAAAPQPLPVVPTLSPDPAPTPVAPAVPTPEPPVDRAPVRTEENLRAVVAAFAKWAPKNEGQPCPSFSSLGLLLDESETKDGWGNALRLTCKEQPSTLQMGVISAGPDGRFATRDDVFSWRLAGASELVRGERWATAKAPDNDEPKQPAVKPPSNKQKQPKPTPAIDPLTGMPSRTITKPPKSR